jgi:hypothetical protein
MNDFSAGSARASTANPVATSRRAVLSELLGVIVVLAIPIGAVSLTARPIPNPPNREAMNIDVPTRLEIEEQQRQEKERRKAAEKQAEDDGSPRDKKERRRSRASEQRASQP